MAKTIEVIDLTLESDIDSDHNVTTHDFLRSNYPSPPRQPEPKTEYSPQPLRSPRDSQTRPEALANTYQDGGPTKRRRISIPSQDDSLDLAASPSRPLASGRAHLPTADADHHALSWVQTLRPVVKPNATYMPPVEGNAAGGGNLDATAGAAIESAASSVKTANVQTANGLSCRTDSGPTPVRPTLAFRSTGHDSAVFGTETRGEGNISKPSHHGELSLGSLQSPAETVSLPNNHPTKHEKKSTSIFSQGETHLLIFLKEVKKLTWKQITATFNQHYDRSYSTLQTSYSMKINRRDRTQDPPILELPACYASEAKIDWDTVRAGLPPPSSGVKRQPREIFQDEFSGAESPTLHERPKRALRPKSYNWSSLVDAAVLDATEDEASRSVEVFDDESEIGTESSPAETALPLERVIAVDNEPVLVDFDGDDAERGIAVQEKQPGTRVQRHPYLSKEKRSSLRNPPPGWEWDQLRSRDWQGTVLHVDFSTAELNLVIETASRVLGVAHASKAHSRSRRKYLERLLRGLSDPKLLRVSHEICEKLPSRDRKSVASFLEDAQIGDIRTSTARIERLGAARPSMDFSSVKRTSTLTALRQRELGLQAHRGWKAPTRHISYQWENRMQDSLGPTSTYTGASSDVHALAWSADGQCFAAAAICVDDPHSMQYNRPNNLLYGDTLRNTVRELRAHYVDRTIPESGPNSTHAMYASQDPNLYKTVSSVVFSPDGKRLFSGGYDQRVCMWETKSDGSQPDLVLTLKHKAKIDMMAVNDQGRLATATRKGSENAIKVFPFPEDDPTNYGRPENFSSSKATSRPDLDMLPTALEFSPLRGNLLLAGFGANVRQDGRDISGDICLWDINSHEQLPIHGSSKNVFDLSFHPRNDWFAVGCVASQAVNRGTRSVVRIYDQRDPIEKFSTTTELECSALDMNDVVWCPGNDFLLAAGCTDGRAYVWDVRWPDSVLRRLSHGQSLMPLDDRIDTEITDTGVRFLSWGSNATRLYTGSSDGVVKVWNVEHSEEDTFVKDLVTLNSGVMSGAFSPDKSRLLIGEVNGSINMLEVGRDQCSVKDAEPMIYLSDEDAVDEFSGPSSDSGTAYANELLASGQMMQVPMGGFPVAQAVQGPHYEGPFNRDADASSLREKAADFQHNLAQDPGPPCEIQSCKDSIIKVTSEETGDSGRSADRIPDELRRQWKAAEPGQTLIPGKSRCSSCGRAARPGEPSSGDGTALCERCSFACFRCGGATKLNPTFERVTCETCNRTWSIGALGYECVEDHPGHDDLPDVPSLQQYSKEMYKAKLLQETQPDAIAEFGDEMNALTDFYLSLAIERPSSPSL